MSRYEAVELGSGWEVIVVAPTLEEAFEAAGYAVFDLSFDLHDMQPTYSRPVVAPGDTPVDLLTGWLEALLWTAGDAGIAFCLFNVDRLEEGGVQGSASGMPISQAVRRPWAVDGVAGVQPPIRVPDGWWIRFEVERSRRLGVVDSTRS